MIAVDEARRRILAALHPLGLEYVPLEQAFGRVLAGDLAARRTQPPVDMSAMDGYAVRAADAATGAALRVTASVAAGSGRAPQVLPGEAVRIFTGSAVPPGADSVLIQENTSREGDIITVRACAEPGRHIRQAGCDFAEGEVLLTAGTRLSARDLALAAAMDHAQLPVRRKPRIAVLATGDEIVPPGTPRRPDQIVGSTSYGLNALIAAWGGTPLDLGIASDDVAALQSAVRQAQGADVIVTLGGASVGEHDLVRAALAPLGLVIEFWKVAMRPGKPLMFGALGQTTFLGLPGNPVSALVCAQLFLKPAIAALLGAPAAEGRIAAVLGTDMPANDQRADFLRAALDRRSAPPVVTPCPVQDSSLLRALAKADALLIRPPFAPPAQAGDPVEAIPLD